MHTGISLHWGLYRDAGRVHASVDFSSWQWIMSGESGLLCSFLVLGTLLLRLKMELAVSLLQLKVSSRSVTVPDHNMNIPRLPLTALFNSDSQTACPTSASRTLPSFPPPQEVRWLGTVHSGVQPFLVCSFAMPSKNPSRTISSILEHEYS